MGGQGRAPKIKKIYVQILRWAKFRPRARDARVDGFAASKGKRLKWIATLLGSSSRLLKAVHVDWHKRSARPATKSKPAVRQALFLIIAKNLDAVADSVVKTRKQQKQELFSNVRGFHMIINRFYWIFMIFGSEIWRVAIIVDISATRFKWVFVHQNRPWLWKRELQLPLHVFLIYFSAR